MQSLPLACFLSLIRPPGVQFEAALLQVFPVDKSKCPYVRDGSDIDFQLYTRHNPVTHQSLAIDDDESLFASNIDFSAPTVLYFHAFMETSEDGSTLMIREAYMNRGDSNLILVDARQLEAGPWYLKAADNTWYIGRAAAKFLDYLVSRGLKLSNTHLVGHSLGAQAAGVAGATLTSGRVSRITGLDPAWPVFCKLPLEQRLDKTDAEFVDVIHTDAGIFGFKYAIGHVDFFPNSGKSPQPGCELEVTLPKQLLLNNFFCSHWRSYQFYSESVIRPSAFVASECPSWRQFLYGQCAGANTTHMGFGVDRKYEQDLTHDALPHSHGLWGVEIILEASAFCENATNTLGYYAFSLKENKPKDIDIRNIIEMTRFFNSITNIVNTKRNTNEDKHKKYNILDIFQMNKHEITRTKETQRVLPFQKFEKHNGNFDTKHRQRRFIPFLKNSESSDNFLFKFLEFLVKYRKNIVPVVTVMREINTLVKSANGELNHFVKERNNYIGTSPPFHPITYNLELDNNSKLKAFVRKLFGLRQGDNLSFTSSKK